jgi:AmmeMemoRadiSam system protein A
MSAGSTARTGGRSFSSDERALLDHLAWLAIDDGLSRGAGLAELRAHRAMRLDAERLEPWLLAHAATFVTLHKQSELRGCIGALQAHQSIAQDVVDHAFAAAFRDPRFPPLRADERPLLTMHISVLGEAGGIDAGSERAVLDALRPHVDGLILTCGHHRATFLPSVWEHTPDARIFLRALKRKAGLPVDGWPEGMAASTYQVQEWTAGQATHA